MTLNTAWRTQCISCSLYECKSSQKLLLESKMYNCCTVCVALYMCCKVACSKLYFFISTLLAYWWNQLIYIYNKCCSSSKLWSHSTLSKSFHLGTLWRGCCRMVFVANFTCFTVVRKFWKSVKIWQSYREFKLGNFFWDTVYMPQSAWSFRINLHSRKSTSTVHYIIILCTIRQFRRAQHRIVHTIDCYLYSTGRINRYTTEDSKRPAAWIDTPIAKLCTMHHTAVRGIYILRNCVMRKILCGTAVWKEPDWLSAKTMWPPIFRRVTRSCRSKCLNKMWKTTGKLNTRINVQGNWLRVNWL